MENLNKEITKIKDSNYTESDLTSIFRKENTFHIPDRFLGIGYEFED